MSGNNSRYSHQRGKRYSQVTMLQGAMVTDADQVEAQAIAQRHDERLAGLSVGSGIPRQGGVLLYATQAGPADVVSVNGLAPGLVVADGMWGEVRLAPGTSLVRPDGLDLVEKQFDCRLSAPAPAAGRFAAIADLWDRHVGPPEDGRLVDPAFLGAETATRKERVAQIKFIPVRADPAGGLRASVEGEAGLPRHGDLRLEQAELATTTVSADPCDPCASSIAEDGGESGNHLFRLEVHESPYDRAEIVATGVTCVSPETGPTPASRIVVKFSKDNGSLEISAAESTLLANDPAFATAVFEIYDLDSEQQPGLALHAPLPRRGRLVDQQGLAGLSAGDLAGRMIRVWDGAASLDLAQSTLTPQPVGLMGVTGSITRDSSWTLSLQVLDLDLTFIGLPGADGVPFVLPGDAFTVNIREYAASPGDALTYDAHPVEVAHRYAFLGEFSNGAFVPETATSDLRSRAFPALTDLTAQDVAWSNHHHSGVAARTAQGAIDLLFARETSGDCLCTFCIDPKKALGEELRNITEALRKEVEADGEDPAGSALICLPKGLHVLDGDGALEIAKLRHLFLIGAGAGATEIRLRGGAQLLVTDCESVTLADLTLTEEKDARDPLVTISNCGGVTLRNAGFAGEPSADAKDDPLPLVLIRSERGQSTAGAEVTSCRFSVLQNRLGLRVVGMGRQIVRDCLFEGASPRRRTRRFQRATSVLEGIQVVAKPRGFIDDPERGFAIVAGNPNLVYDLTALPPPDRVAAMKFLTSATGKLGLAGPASTEEFEQQKTVITEVGRAVLTPGGTLAALAHNAAVPGAGGIEGPGGEGPRIFGRVPAPLTRDLEPLRRTPGLEAGTPPLVTIIPAGDPFGPIRSGDIQILIDPNQPVIIDKPGRDNLFKDFDELFRDTRDIIYQRNFGLWLAGGALAEARVTGNRFEWLHSAIILHHDAVDPKSPVILTSGKTTIRDNLILRAPLTGKTQAIVLGENLSAAITVINGGYLTLADNTVEQMAGEAEAAAYVDYLTHGELTPDYEGFAAIRLAGLIGPVVHVTANDAAYFKHVLLIQGEARSQAVEAREPWRRSNLWTFRDNTVLPVLRSEAPVFAMKFDPDLDVINRSLFVRLGMQMDDYNHPWWLDG